MSLTVDSQPKQITTMQQNSTSFSDDLMETYTTPREVFTLWTSLTGNKESFKGHFFSFFSTGVISLWKGLEWNLSCE